MTAPAAPHRTCVLGLGNLMRTDDAVGMLALHRLAEDPRLPQDVEIVEGGTLGLDLLHHVYGLSHLLVLDAVDTGNAPGTLTRFSGSELARLPTSRSVHLLGLSDLMNVLLLMDAPPLETVLLGIQPESTEWGTTLTPHVEAARQSLVEAALSQLADWHKEIALPAARVDRHWTAHQAPVTNISAIPTDNRQSPTRIRSNLRLKHPPT